MASEPPGRVRSTGEAWARAVAWIGVVALLVGASVYVFQTLVRVPERVVSGGKEITRGLLSVAEAFRSGTITTRFLSHATEVAGSSRLQFATLREIELFERTDEATVLWGQLALPDVVVEARAPVEYTYFLDLTAAWEFHREGQRIQVVAPAIEFNKPAIDASEIRYTVRTGSVLRDESQALIRLKAGLTEMSYARARDNVDLVRELGRKEVARFVAAWVGPSFGDGERYAVEVVFADEALDLDLPRRRD